MSSRFNTDTLVSDLKSVVRDSEQLLQAVAGATGEKADELRERLADTIESARETCRNLEGKTKDTLKAADTVVRDHPYQSLGVALALGVILGVVVARK
jgi:ElaB/YqjD/DUF883 family membrane-anchored ribosome-binding protein